MRRDAARLPAVAGQLRRHARQAGAVAARAASRWRGSCARPRRAARRGVRFVSGLYFRGKLTYARRFAAPPEPDNPIVGCGVHVITPNAGLRSPDTLRDAARRARVRAAATSIADNARYRRPLERAPARCAREIGPDCDVVLLGSVASPKYVDVLLDDLRRAAAVSDRLRRPRRHEPRRAAAAAGRATASSSSTCRSPAPSCTARGRRSCRRSPADSRRGLRWRRARADAFRAISDNVVADGRRARGPPDQPAQGLLARARPHQGRSAAVLRRRRRRAAAAPARSRDGDEALSARRRRRVLLHEARADAAARRGSRPARSSTARATSSTFR